MLGVKVRCYSCIYRGSHYKILPLFSFTGNTFFTFIDDNVYLNDEPSRKEYVLNDAGIIYKGTHKQIYEKPWSYGQVCLFDFTLHSAIFKATPLGLGFMISLQ